MLNDFLKNYTCAGELLEIRIYPDPVLLKKAAPVKEFNEKLKELAKNMLYTMYQAPGVGLAAPQVGQSIRLFVMDTDYQREKQMDKNGDEVFELSNFNPRVLINPKITVISNEKIAYQEGCLSVPGVYEDVIRPTKVSVEYQDLDGNLQSFEAEGITAVCLQHEFDHLEGIVFIDRLSLIKRNILKKKFKKSKHKEE